MTERETKQIVIIGAGFGGLYAAKELINGNSSVRVTLIDKANFHLFQPLLYQVATAQLSPEDIAYPIRAIFKNKKNITILKEKVSSVDLDNKLLKVECGSIFYDKLIISVGVTPDYFGNEIWRKYASPLKTLKDALEIRRRILNVFERAESEMLHPCDEYPLNFIIIGGGPTGIELSGALAELRKYTLRNEFRKIKPERAKIYLIEAGKTILPGFPNKLIQAAHKSLNKLGVTIKTNSFVTDIGNDTVEVQVNGEKEIIKSKAVFWAAGVKAKFGSNILSSNKNINFDKKGRMLVNKDLSLQNYNDVFVIGDFGNFKDKDEKPLPGTAPVAMQQGRYAAKKIKATLKNKPIPQFKYRNKGTLAVIGRNSAIADFGFLKVTGFFAWLLWVFVHIGYLVGFENKILVMTQWALNYLGRKATSRIIYSSIRSSREASSDVSVESIDDRSKTIINKSHIQK